MGNFEGGAGQAVFLASKVDRTVAFNDTRYLVVEDGLQDGARSNADNRKVKSGSALLGLSKRFFVIGLCEQFISGRHIFEAEQLDDSFGLIGGQPEKLSTFPDTMIIERLMDRALYSGGVDHLRCIEALEWHWDGRVVYMRKRRAAKGGLRWSLTFTGSGCTVFTFTTLKTRLMERRNGPGS